MRRFHLFLSVAAFTPLLTSQVVYVDRSAPSGGDGKSWTTAYKAPAVAFNAEGANKTYWIARGQYGGGNLTIPENSVVLGGFRRGMVRETQRDHQRNAVAFDGGGNNSVVTMSPGSTLDGIFIQGGYSGSGAGLTISNAPGCTVRNCTIQANATFSGNGAGLLVSGNSDPMIEHTIVASNNFQGSEPSSGAYDVANPGGTYNHCLFTSNAASGLEFGGGSQGVVRNSMFVGNGGAGISINSRRDIALEHNLFYQNGVFDGTTTVNGAAAINALPLALNNVVGNPRFVDATSQDFHLRFASPAIDAGMATGLKRDFEYYPRSLDSAQTGTKTPDIGLHEYSEVTMDISGNATPGGQMTIAVTGNHAMFLLIGPRMHPGFDLGPIGPLFLDPALHITVVDMGLGPISTNVSVPATFPTGVGVGFQVLGVAGPTALTFSNAQDILFQ